MRFSILMVTLTLTLGIWMAVDANRTSCCMSRRSLDWTITFRQEKFGVAEYSFRDIRSQVTLKFPDPRRSMVYFGPLGSSNCAYALEFTALLCGTGICLFDLSRRLNSIG